MKQIKWLLFILCVSLSLHLWADEEENSNIKLSDVTICVNDNESLPYDGDLLQRGELFLYSLSLPISSETRKIVKKKMPFRLTNNQEYLSNNVTTYTITVNSEGDNGYVSWADGQLRNGSMEITVEEGSSFTLTAIPDEGYRVKSIHMVKTGFLGSLWEYTDKESISHSNTVNKIKTDVSYRVEFEKIPIVLPTYTITIISEGDFGCVSWADGQLRNGSMEITVEEGSSFTLTAIPDEGYRVKSIHMVKTGFLGSLWEYTDKESISHSNTVNKIKTDVSYRVEFEKIPIVLPTYTITIISEGDFGCVSWAAGQLRNGSMEIIVEEGSSFTLTAIPDEGYRVKSIRMVKTGFLGSLWEYTDKESISHSNTVNNIKTDVSYRVEFERINVVSTMNIVTLVSNTEHGYTNHLGDNVRNMAKTYSVEMGTDFSITAIPDEGYRVKNIIRKMQNSNEETWNYSDNNTKEQEFTSYSVSKDQTIEVNFERIPGEVDDNIYLAIFQTNNDCTKLQVEKGEKVRLQIKAADNWRVESVSYNGIDVTSELVDGYYTTPEIYQNSELHIVYESYYR